MKFYHILCTTLSLVTSFEAACTSPKLRKEIRDLTDDEYNRYVKAVVMLNKRSSSTSLSPWEKFAQTHQNGGNQNRAIHGTPAFLPWHRKFIRMYELELQKIDPSVNLPYWDWSYDYDAPHLSPVLTPTYIGGNGNSNKNMILDKGPFNNTQLIYPNKHSLSRQYDRGDSLSKYTSPSELNLISNESRFSYFADRIESVHGTPHVTIGGDYDFGTYTSPNDPIFFLHHAFIDLLWAKWQDKSGNANKYEGQKQGMSVNPSDKLYSYTDTVQSTFNYKADPYCYDYPVYPRNLTPKRTNALVARDFVANGIVPNDIIEKLIRGLTFDKAVTTLQTTATSLGLGSISLESEIENSMSPLPLSWITKNQLDLDSVRKFEKNQVLLRSLIKKLNPVANKLPNLSLGSL